MYLLSGVDRQEDRQHILLVFGVGLIGLSIVTAFLARTRGRSQHFPLSWTEPRLQFEDLQRLEAEVRAYLEQQPRARLTAVWSAGRAGFSASEEDTRVELDSYRRALAFFEGIALSSAVHRPQFLLFSSAGGLFEGQRLVGGQSLPKPLRPYAELKLKQEELLHTVSAPINARIFRLTSVFGHIRPGQRLGLIPTLVTNGLRQEVTSLSGRDTTLRDYLWVEDVAAFTLGAILDGGSENGIETKLLAAGRPASLMEIKGLVQKILGRRIYVSYQPEASNQQDITFSPSALPSNWYPSDLGLGIRRVHAGALAQGSIFTARARA